MDRCFNLSGDNTPIDPSLRRSLFKIVWSCATTLFACTYVAIHPNISVDESDGVVLLRRIGLMIAMGLVPELVVLWALQQRLLASSLRIMHRDQKWTQAHSYFMIMGGFCYYDETGVRKTLDYNKLKDLHRRGELQWPTPDIVSAPEITDRSKADLLTKVIVIVQTLWFCIQFITRLILHLDVTELETATFAYAVLNVVVYMLWMNKPFDVRSQILLRGVHDPDFVRAEDNTLPLDPPKATAPKKKEKEAKEYVREKLATWRLATTSQVTDVLDVLLFPYEVLQRILINPFANQYTNYTGPCARPSSEELQSYVTPTNPIKGIWKKMDYWFLRMFTGKDDKSTTYPFAICVAIIFGGIHLIAWPYHFPSVPEMWLWRASSLALVAPAVLLSIIRMPGVKTLSGYMPPILTTPVAIFVFLCIPVIQITYVIARIIILFLPLIALRRLPCEAFEDINWLGIFFPHI